MVKKVKYTYKGMNRDTSKSKHPADFYFEAKNIRITATDGQSMASIQNEKGNKEIVSLPNPCIDITARTITYGDKSIKFKSTEFESQLNETDECNEVTTLQECSGNQQVIGHTITRTSVILFSTDDAGFDCIWEVNNLFEGDYELTLLYCRNLGFSTDNPIQAVFNYENTIIQKIYWVDSKNQLRFLNIKHSVYNGDLEELIDLNSTSLDAVGLYDISQPTVLSVTQGGNHTSGMIQYAYNLYKLNGSQTSISPLSELISLDNGELLGGGEVNEIVGASPFIEILGLDRNYTHIRIYAVKYTSFGEEPSIDLITDQEIDNYDVIRYFDNGTSIAPVALSEFLFLGSNLLIPKHIESKDNRLLMANIKELPFNFEADCRAYGHNADREVRVWENVIGEETNVNGETIIIAHPDTEYDIDTSTYLFQDRLDAVNPDYETYSFQADGETPGGEGKFIKYELTQTPLEDLSGSLKNTRFFKDDEIYRIGIQFYNIYGQKSLPIWIADFKARSGNLQGNYNTLKVTLKPEFFSFLEEACLDKVSKPVGYKIIRAERGPNDKTIVTQGFIGSMCAQYVGGNGKYLINYGTVDIGPFVLPLAPYNPPTSDRLIEINKVMDDLVKRPQLMLKNLSAKNSVSGLHHGWNMCTYGAIGRVKGDENEIHTDYDINTHQVWQHTKMMQLYSPELLFTGNTTFGGGVKFRAKGITERIRTGFMGETIQLDSGNTERELTYEEASLDRGNGLPQDGWVGPSRDDTKRATIYMNRKMHYHEGGDFFPFTTDEEDNTYVIYGSPEFTGRGQSITSYNGDARYKYLNSLKAFITDEHDGKRSNYDEVGIRTINSEGVECVTFMLGTSTMGIEARKGLEEVWDRTGLGGMTEGIVIGEFVYPTDYRYIGNIYGGTSKEAKSRTTYVEIGAYTKIDEDTVNIESPGDMFVQKTKIGRIIKSDEEVLRASAYQLTDIVECTLESSINSLNRNDLSLQDWTVKSQPRYDEYYKYNRVYSQSSDLIQNTSLSFKFKKVNEFDTRVMASKVKVPGEIIDSFTDFLENEIIDLDGKYGAINAMVNFKDSIFTLQDKGVSKLVINPRTLVQDEDGVALELGTGGILHDYTYLSTTSGSVNKWSVVNSPSGFYFLDVLNKSWNKFANGGVQSLTDGHGLSVYFRKNLDYDSLKNDNPLKKQGASTGYNFIDNNAYLTVNQASNSFTVNFNDLSNSFESFHDYTPSIYISTGNKMITTNPELGKLYEHDAGEYQKFYEEYYPSYVILQVNPEADLDCVFNNIEYKSEMYLDDLDQPQRTLSHITAWNEYQASNRVPLVLGRDKNLRRKFRNWQANIPRQAGSRDRIRNPWIFLKLELDQTDNLRMVLHDVIIHYTS